MPLVPSFYSNTLLISSKLVMTTNKFVYGAQYYRPPTPPRAQRKNDLKRIKELGFNTIKIQAMWNWVNPQPDIFDFEEIRELMDSAEENGIGVIILTNLENAPYWLVEKYPEARYVASHGEVIDLQSTAGCPSGGWPGLCLDHEGVKNRAEMFLRRIAEVFKDHRALFCWHVWEEPHMAPLLASLQPWQVFCSCESTLRKFHGWLRKRYKTLQSLNDAWNTRYADWKQIKPPPRWLGCYSLQLDWMRFQEWDLAEMMAWRVKTIRTIDENHPVVSHLGSDCPYSDLWKLAKPVDRWGCSVFPGWMENHLYEVGLQLDTAISSARGKTCWVGELQAGASGPLGKDIFISSCPSPREIAAWNWLTVAHGMKGILYWQYRPETLGPEAPGFGLCGMDGNFTDRSEVASKICQILNNHSVFIEGKPSEAKVGILYSKDVLNLLFCATGKLFGAEPMNSSFKGIYRTLWQENVPIQIVHVEETSLPEMNKLKAIYAPIPLCMNEKQAEKLKEYVNSGGTLISECHVAQYNIYGYCNEKVPGMGLDELFGCIRTDDRRATEEKVLFKDQKIEAKTFRETYGVTTGTAKGFYKDGSTAIVENNYGKGKAILFGSLVFENPKNSNALVGLLPEEISGGVNVTPAIFARTLSTAEEKAVILINTKKTPVNAKVEVSGVSSLSGLQEIWQGKKVLCKGNHATLTLKPLESAVLLL